MSAWCRITGQVILEDDGGKGGRSEQWLGPGDL